MQLKNQKKMIWIAVAMMLVASLVYVFTLDDSDPDVPKEMVDPQ